MSGHSTPQQVESASSQERSCRSIRAKFIFGLKRGRQRLMTGKPDVNLNGCAQNKTECLSSLQGSGWTTLQWPATERLARLGSWMFGADRLESSLRPPKSEILRATGECTARPGSKSAMRGLHEFPLHTDRAFDRLPPRYLFLRSISGQSASSTQLVAFDDVEVDKKLASDLRAGLWVTGNSRRAHVCAVLEGQRVRWDADCMRPMDRIAKRAHINFSEVLHESSHASHIWSDTCTVLVVDNWRTLHGRMRVCQSEGRTLERLLVEVN